MLETWVPWVLATGNVTSAWLSGRRNKWGWALLVLTQLAFIVYAMLTMQYGFLLQNLAMMAIGVYNYVVWTREGKRTSADGRTVRR